MESLAYIHACLIWEEQEEQLDVPHIQVSSIPGLLILILILTPLINLYPVFAAQLLARGNRGQDVVRLQNDLKQAGCFPGGVRSTGYYGKITKAAVTKLQQTHDLRVDGVVGEQTRNAVESGKTCQSLASSGVLKVGSRGEKVSQLQFQLNNWGFPVKKVDGVFGKETHAAVIRFQELQGLKPDGIVDPKTTQVLWTPRTQVSQSAVNSEVEEVGNPEVIQSALDQFTIESLEQDYYIPTFQKVNKLKSNLQSDGKQKQYRAALELVQIWKRQQENKHLVQEYSTINNFYRPLNPTIIVSVANKKNNSNPEKLIQEKLPVNLLQKIFDDAMEEDDKPRQQFITAGAPVVKTAEETESCLQDVKKCVKEP